MRRALEGINVLDFSWVATGPLHTKCLADFGATVIRIESVQRPDLLRYAAPYKDGVPGLDRSGYYAPYNTNKLGISLNLNHPKALEIAKRLVLWADVVVESFVPGTMERWGLAYEELKKIKADIVMFRTSQLGQYGPHAHQPGYGPHLSAFTGFASISGWPDGLPIAPYGAHTDFVAPRFGIPALIAALIYRRKTGKGQCLDLSQLEAGIQFLAPLCLDYTVNAREMSRKGNASSCAAPCGAYRCRGEDRWCVIEVTTDSEWEAFCRAIGYPDWCKEERFATLASRKKNEEELNNLVESWTINFTAEEVMTRLQMDGVSAGVVATIRDLLEDPQLKYYKYFWWLNHPELGLFPYFGEPMHLSKTPAQARLPSPCLGEHTQYVCQEILGMGDEEFVSCLNEGVFG